MALQQINEIIRWNTNVEFGVEEAYKEASHFVKAGFFHSNMTSKLFSVNTELLFG
jgi:hypothetical protein